MDQSIIQLASKYPTIKTLLDQFHSDRVQLAIEVNNEKRFNDDEADSSIKKFIEERITDLRSKFIMAVNDEMKRNMAIEEYSNEVPSPSWMTDSQLRACKSAMYSTDKIPCKGCGIEFNCKHL